MSVGADAAASILAAFSGDVGTVSVTFSRKTVTSVSGGDPTFGTTSTTTANAFVLPPSEGAHMAVWGKGVDPGSLSSAEYAFLWVAASGMSFAPRAVDTVSISGETWTVLGCDPYALSGVALVYAVGVCKQ